MRKFAIVFLATAGLCGPFAANATLVQNSPVAPNTPPVMSVSGATVVPNDLSNQIAHLNGEVSTLQQQVQTILQQPAVTAQAPARLYPDSVGG
jgi:TolA-binding protein